MTSIAIIDTIGLVYDGSTLQKRGLGGSESAIILISKELAQLGFDVTVYNNCQDAHTLPGVYDNVVYKPIIECTNQYHDIVISSRTVLPFCDANDFKDFTNHDVPFETFAQIKKAKLKILWLHDTFCVGDILIEKCITSGLIDEIFTLSDFHTSYITNCDHGLRRNFEILKNKVFITRNGVVNYKDWVDVLSKDRNLFVYNASVTKGMIPLVTKIWPEVKKRIPTAKLTIIGGYYRFRDGAPPDKQEEDWHKLRAEYEAKNLDITFTGVIPQHKIADILEQASFFIYPGSFPETFGISSLEALIYNVPILTCRFGAMEETAIENASYQIDYAIEPNGLFPHINTDLQCAKFVEMTVAAYENTYLHQQKMYACNIVKDIAGWDTISLQWKQHFYHKLGLYMPISEYRKVKEINNAVHRIFKRRFSNTEEWMIDKKEEQKIVVIIPFYNAEAYIKKCIESVMAQDYYNWKIVLINDASTDNSNAIVTEIIAKYGFHFEIDYKINSVNVGAVKNQIDSIRLLNDNNIVMLLDGDDALVNNPHIFDYYNNLFHTGVEYSYGSCWSVADNIPLIAQPYPPSILKDKAYRSYSFNWKMPYPHTRVFRKYLINNLSDDCFKDANGNWFRAGGDNSTFYNIIEQAESDRIYVCPEIHYLYNDTNALNDYKVHSKEQNENMTYITNMKKSKKKILIALPTAKYVETETFKALYDLIIPDGFETELQFFYGYRIDQIRNLIANWAVRYDYLFSVDSDIVMPEDTLVKMINHNVDIVSGLYIQRIPGTHNLELYDHNGRIEYDRIKNHHGLIEITGCGFGCALIKSEVFKSVDYPQFEYHPALDHKDTISEDTDFCAKAKKKGFRVFADTTIKCKHKGTVFFEV